MNQERIERTAPNAKPRAKARPAEVVAELSPFEAGVAVHGVTFDGTAVWVASGESLHAIDPATGKPTRAIACASDAGTAFDGKHLYQVAADRIHKIDAASGAIVGSIPAPGNGRASGLTWAEGTLWVGQYQDRKIHQIDAQTGAVLRTIASDKFVTGVTWVDGELWHGTWEGDDSDIRQIDPSTGDVLQRLELPTGTGVSGLECDGGDLFYCGGGKSGKLRIVRKPK